MNIFGDVVEAFEGYYHSEEETVQALNELHFRIRDDSKRSCIELDECIQDYTDKKNVCNDCGYKLTYNEIGQSRCEQCDNIFK